MSFLDRKVVYREFFRNINARKFKNLAVIVALFNISRNDAEKRGDNASSHNFVIVAYRIFDYYDFAFFHIGEKAKRSDVLFRVERVGHNLVITYARENPFHLQLVFLLFGIAAGGDFRVFHKGRLDVFVAVHSYDFFRKIGVALDVLSVRRRDGRDFIAVNGNAEVEFFENILDYYLRNFYA